MIDIHRLKIFVKIAELKSFTLAAECCFLTQPTVSQHINTLEQFLGLQLFNRGGRDLSLTGAGEILYHHASRVTRDLTNSPRRLISIKAKKAGGFASAQAPYPVSGSYPPYLRISEQHTPMPPSGCALPIRKR